MIAILDYEAGNLRSVERALRHLGMACRITKNREDILKAPRVIFPGVGAAGRAMEVIRSSGLDRVILEVVRRAVPFLGICLGAQVLLSESEENDTPCLGILEGKSLRFRAGVGKIPHMGWNDIVPERHHPILEGVDRKAQFYFVHSYYPSPLHEEDVIARTDYGISFPCVIGRGNVVATQFHPEKSGTQGLLLLKNFCAWDGRVSPC